MEYKYKEIVQFLREFRNGSSLPLLMQAGDGHYVVKLKGGGDGIAAAIIEWIAMGLAHRLGLPLPDVELLRLPEDFQAPGIDPEIQELLERSPGINIATRYLSGGRDYTATDRERTGVSSQHDIFLFDLFLLNIDRTEKNPNLLWHKNQLYCLDFSGSLKLRGLCEGVEIPSAPFLNRLRKHPFYDRRINPAGFIERLREANLEKITDIIDTLPDSWLVENNREQSITRSREELKQRLRSILTGWDDDSVDEELERLRNMEPESEEERQARALRNKLAFQKRHGRL